MAEGGTARCMRARSYLSLNHQVRRTLCSAYGRGGERIEVKSRGFVVDPLKFELRERR